MHPLEIVYQDSHLIAINKPQGLLVHPSSIARDADTSVLQELKTIEDRYYYLVHRLDRKTSGLLLVALDKLTQSEISKKFQERQVVKKYHAIVRGFVDERGLIDYPIKNDKGKVKEAQTEYRLMEQFEIPFSSGKHKTSRYSLIELTPQTGRFHQLRMHMAHIFHPIIGDRPHGCNKQNRFFKEEFNMNKMLLHANYLKFVHPISNVEVEIKANYPVEFKRMLDLLKRKKGNIQL